MLFSHESKIKILNLEQITYEKKPSRKPDGLWISIDNDWQYWCKENDYNGIGITYDLQIDIEKILIIKNLEDLLIFNQTFLIPAIWEIHNQTGFIINWNLVSQVCKGIIILNPHDWDFQSPDLDWLYGWDCKSGCIWDLTAIKTIKERN